MQGKCYVVSSGCVYEGGWTESVHLSKESAIKVAKKLVGYRQQDNNEAYERSRERHKVAGYKPPEKIVYRKDKEREYWTDGYDYVQVVEFELMP
jgi:hypothetical protein